MTSDDEKDLLRKLAQAARGEGAAYCPICWYRVKDSEARDKHLEDVHDYHTYRVETQK